MFEILHRQFRESAHQSRDGLPAGPAMVETDPKIIARKHTIEEVAETFEALRIVAELDEREIEDDYLARDVETGRWYTPFDVNAAVDATPDSEDTDDDLPF